MIGRIREGGRQPLRRDPIESQLVDDRFEMPQEGDLIEIAGDVPQRWSRLTAQADGWITAPALRSGYALCTYDSARDEVLLLDARDDVRAGHCLHLRHAAGCGRNAAAGEHEQLKCSAS